MSRRTREELAREKSARPSMRARATCIGAAVLLAGGLAGIDAMGGDASVCLWPAGVARASAAETIAPAQNQAVAVVPFSVEGAPGTVRIVAEEDAPQAEPARLELEGSGSSSISIAVPGDYRYTVYQEQGTDEKVTYDRTEYHVTVSVTVAEDGSLGATLTASVPDSAFKPASIHFVNERSVEPQPSEPSPPAPSPSKPATGSGQPLARTGDADAAPMLPLAAAGVAATMAGAALIRRRAR